MSDVHILASGVDSVYLSIKGELFDGLTVCLKAMRELNPDQEIPFSFHDIEPDMTLHSYGWRGYPYWLSSPNYEICLGAAHPFPPAYMQLHSEYIHSVGIETAIGDTEAMLAKDFFPKGYRTIVSRADIFADEQGWNPTHDDFQHFTCRGVRKGLFEVPRQEHAAGRQLSGFTFGKGDIVARIYDKTLESHASGKTWPTLLWQGRDEEHPVWRVEFQFRRGALSGFGITSTDDLLRHRQGLWQYGMQWLSLRRGTGDGNRGRWPVAQEWTQLKSANLGGGSHPLIREHIRNANALRLTQGLVGYATSLEAIDEAKNLGQLVLEVPVARKYLIKKGVHFNDIVDEKRKQLLQVTTFDGPAR